MNRFENSQRVIVSNPDPKNEQLRAKCGTVVRLRRADYAAWVEMDDILPTELQSFPALDIYGEPEPRNKHIMLWPDECEPLPLAQPEQGALY